MIRIAAALAALLVLGPATTAGAVDFGANDDTGKYADNPVAFFQKMAALGMKQNVMTVRWTPGSSAITDLVFLQRAVPAALAAGIKPIFAVYPYPPADIEAGRAAPDAFAAWLGALASAFPAVTTYIVGNEPNLNTFWRPQGDGTRVLSAASFGPFLAAGYDALHLRGIEVLGVGHSPRGDLRPDRAGKTAPVAWIKALGEWYRASGRTAPLMDGFSYHPYPNPSDFTVPLTWTYGWPNAGVQELPRVKQALWDAFNGTPQPTTLQGLKLFLDEVGWQVDTSGKPGYTGTENVKVTTEANQAQIYGDLIRFIVCDPDVAQLNFFGFYDERAREGWQAAPYDVNGEPRPSAEAIRQAIAQTGGRCQGTLRTWQPATGVVGGAADFGDQRQFGAKQRVFAFRVTGEEDYAWKAGVFPAGTSQAEIGRQLAARAQPVLTAEGEAKAYSNARVELRGALPDGRYVFGVRMTAWANGERVSTFVSEPFTVGTGGAAAGGGSSAPKAATRVTEGGSCTVVVTGKGAWKALYRTVDGTAKAGQDYRARKGLLSATGAKGKATARTVVVQTLRDARKEKAETFSVKVTRLSGNVASRSYTCTIVG